MKLKTLRKKISRLEIRLQEGPKKLAKLKRKLEAQVAANAAKAKRKAASRARKARQTVEASQTTQRKSPPSTAKPQAKPVNMSGPIAAAKVKRKLNLSPERRAQLAAAMKARWAAKKAAAEPTAQETSTPQDFTIHEIPHSP